MAEGGQRSFTASTYKGSEEVIEFPCVPCARQGITTEAVNFCSDCSEYYCHRCTTDHMKFGLTASHKVVNRKKVKQTGNWKKPPVQLPTERCKEHNDELIKLFCRDHNVVVCNTCVSMNHRSCDGIFEISQISIDFDNRQDVPRVKEELSTSLEAIQATRQRTQQLAAKADCEKEKQLRVIEDNTERLVQHAYAIRTESISAVIQRHKERVHVLSANLTSLEETSATIEQRLEKLSNFSSKNASQVFVDTKLAIREAAAAKQLEQRVKSDVTVNVTSTFVIDGRVDVVLSDVNSLGKIVEQKPFNAVMKDTYDVGVEKENYVCVICDICQLPGGEFIITDHGNGSIKKLDETFKVIKTFEMPSSPWGVCKTRPSEIAVTLTLERKVQFVDISGRWKLTTSFQVDENCRGIAHRKNELIVTGGGHPGTEDIAPEGPSFVAIYSMSGSRLRKIQQDSHGRNLFSVPYHIVTTNNGKGIHVVDKKGGVINLDRHGYVLSTFSENTVWAAGLCSVDDNTLIVCDLIANSVRQITTDGELVGELLSERDGIDKPRCVFYSPSNSSLIVMFYKSYVIKVFKLK